MPNAYQGRGALPRAPEFLPPQSRCSHADNPINYLVFSLISQPTIFFCRIYFLCLHSQFRIILNSEDHTR
jgi:hypothetical protein